MPRQTWAFAVAGPARSQARPIPHSCASRTGSTRRSCTSWPTRQRIHSCWGSDWPQRATLCRSSANPRQMPPAQANPIAGVILAWIAVGDSQSGNFIKTFVHLGSIQTSQHIVWDGVFPRIAARQTPINFRFALPGGAGTLYEPGSEPIVWWGRYQDKVRGRAAASLLDRCAASHTCPKVIEAFGACEFWASESARIDWHRRGARHSAPRDVRRYYYPGTTHGGGRGGFQVDAAPTGFGGCTLSANPNPEADTTRALTAALIEYGRSKALPLRRVAIHGSTKASWLLRRRRPSDFRICQTSASRIRLSIRFSTTTSVPCSSRIT